MANQHKIVIYVKPTRRAVNIRLRGHGNVLRLPLSGYEVVIPNQPIPSTATVKDYLTSILDTCISNLE